MIPSMIDSELGDVFTPTSLQDCSAFITGGGSGIGLSIAATLSALGAKVGICGRSSDKLDAARAFLESNGSSVFAESADVRDEAQMGQVLLNCQNQNGPISFLVCGAAGNFVAPANEISSKGFKTVIDIDLLGTFNAAKLALPQLKETNGSALFISAGQAFDPYYGQAHVGAAKAGIEMLMQTLALEWGENGVRVNCVVPGPIAETKGMDVLGGDAADDLWRPTIPLGRLGLPGEVASAAAFLASPVARFITGTSLRVDGGQNLTGSYRFNQMVRQTPSAK